MKASVISRITKKMSKTCDMEKGFTGAIKVASLLMLELGWFLFTGYNLCDLKVKEPEGTIRRQARHGSPEAALSPGMWQALDSEKDFFKMGYVKA